MVSSKIIRNFIPTLYLLILEIYKLFQKSHMKYWFLMEMKLPLPESQKCLFKATKIILNFSPHYQKNGKQDNSNNCVIVGCVTNVEW